MGRIEENETNLDVIDTQLDDNEMDYLQAILLVLSDLSRSAAVIAEIMIEKRCQECRRIYYQCSQSCIFKRFK